MVDSSAMSSNVSIVPVAVTSPVFIVVDVIRVADRLVTDVLVLVSLAVDIFVIDIFNPSSFC